MEPRIALLPLYFTLFDEFMPSGLRERREQAAESVRSQLPVDIEALVLPLVDSPASAIEAARAVRSFDADGLILLPTMAAPPSYVLPALEACPDASVLLVAIQGQASVSHPYNTDVATENSSPVGACMLSNVLVRQDRRFTMALGVLGGSELQGRLNNWTRGLAAASVVRALRLGVLGDPIPGYVDVEVGEEDLQRLGPTAIHIEREQLTHRFDEADPMSMKELAASLSVSMDAAGVGRQVLSRSLRLCAAIRDLSDEYNLDGGTVNCHGTMFRSNPAIGITACLAVSERSSRGQLFSCTGDIPTAVALAVGNALAGAALYGEIYQLDLPGNWLLFANGGEGDTRCAGGPAQLLEEDHYLGEEGAGVAVKFEILNGPATLLSLSPAPHAQGGWVLVAAEGAVRGAGYPELEGPHGRFQFDSLRVEEGFGAWLQAGATHHAALVPGHHRLALQTCADQLGIELRLL